MADDAKTLTNNFGAPVPDNQRSLTAGVRGPVLLQDYFLIASTASASPSGRYTPRAQAPSAPSR